MLDSDSAALKRPLEAEWITDGAHVAAADGWFIATSVQ